MANSDFLDVLSPSALADLQKANTELTTMIKNVSTLNSKKIGTPSGADSSIKNLSAEYAKQEKLMADMQIKLERLAQTQNRTKISNNALEKSEISLSTARTRNEKAIDRENAKLQASQNLYNKTQQQLNNITKVYNDLITRKLRYDNLSANEEKRLITLQKVTERYNTTLKAVDATIGKNQRNVGNYASAFNPLSNPINQLTREMPAFTYSVQTGFMALSNNIPIFTDAISNAIKQNKALQAEGKPTTSVLSQLTGAFFSWGTALSVGITLLTVYGKEIGTFIQETFKGSKAVDTLKESQKQLNEISTQGAKNAVEETLRLKSLLAIAKDTSLSYKERVIAVNELQSTYPAYFGNLKQEQILAGNTAIAERQLTEAILSRAKANAAVSKITENQGKIIDLEVKKLQVLKEQAKWQSEVNKQTQIQSQVIGGGTVAGTYDLSTTAITKLAGSTRSLNSINTELNGLNKINNILTSFALEKQKEAILLDYKEEKGIKSKTDAKKKEAEIEQITNSSSLQALQNTIAKLKESYENATIGSVQYGLLANQIKLLEEIYNGLTKSIEASNEALDDGTGIALNLSGSEFITDADGDALMEAGNRLRALLKEFKQGFIDDFADQSGFGKTLDLLSGGLEKFEGDAVATALAVSDAFQEAFNTIAEMSNANFDNEYANLEKQKNVALLFAGESASARAEIEAQAEQKRREIARREFQAQKQLALFNIAINTAQAIVGALATLPSPSAVPLSITVGAIGLIQAGVVASRQVPEFWKGTENHKGGLMKINDRGLGQELVITPDGKAKIYSGKDVIVDAPAGTKVKTAKETMDFLMFNNDLNAMLSNSGISSPIVNVQSNATDLTPVVNAINNKPTTNININKGGLDVYVKNGHTSKVITNRRTSFIGYGV